MTFLERLDARLLGWADRFVAWNRDRGRADQWEMARASLDIGYAMLFATYLLALYATRTYFSTHALYLFLFAVFWFVRKRETTSIRRLSSMKDGAARARITEARMRMGNALVFIALAALSLIDTRVSDISFLIAIATFDAALYLKAAEPPPPAKRTEVRLATSST